MIFQREAGSFTHVLQNGFTRPLESHEGSQAEGFLPLRMQELRGHQGAAGVEVFMGATRREKPTNLSQSRFMQAPRNGRSYTTSSNDDELLHGFPCPSERLRLRFNDVLECLQWFDPRDPIAVDEALWRTRMLSEEASSWSISNRIRASFPGHL